MNNVKVYVPVKVSMAADGEMMPLEITWEDGKKYEIDKVKQIRQAPAIRAGGMGDRYTVVIQGRESYLFFERSPRLNGPCIGKWFVERK